MQVINLASVTPESMQWVMRTYNFKERREYGIIGSRGNIERLLYDLMRKAHEEGCVAVCLKSMDYTSDSLRISIIGFKN